MVMENIFRHAEMGKDRVRAASEGTKEITFAALAATHRRHRDLHARRLHERRHRQVLPAVRRHALGRRRHLVRRGHLARSGALRADAADHVARRTGRRRPARRPGLRRARRAATRGRSQRSLRFPWTVLAMGVAVWASRPSSRRKIPQEFVPSQDQSRLSVRITTAVGANLAATDALVRRAEACLDGAARGRRRHGQRGRRLAQLGVAVGHAASTRASAS